MNLLGSGYFYNAYDLGNGRVVKKQKGLWQTLRNHKLKNLPLVFRQNTIAKKNTDQVKDRLDENLGRLLGNPRFSSRYTHTQDKVQLLMDYFDKHSLDENKAAIDAYVELTLNLLDYGIHDYVYKFKNSYGFTSSEDLVCIDFNEVTFSKAETLDYVARRHWLTEAQYRKFPEGPLKQYFKDAMEARLTPEAVESRFGSLLQEKTT